MKGASFPHFTEEDNDEDTDERKQFSCVKVTQEVSGVRKLTRGQRHQAVKEGQSLCSDSEEGLLVT